MADNCSSMEEWAYSSAFAESASWIADTFARENEVLTKALRISLSDESSISETISSTAYFPAVLLEAVDTESSGTAAKRGSRPSNSIACSPLGKISKRKSRASKRSPTTYINADPANFRQMVQEVTGVRLGESVLPVDQMVKPEPQRTGVRLPTLDTSALLLDRTCSSFANVPDAPIIDFEPFPSFPTLESWGI